MSEQDRLKRERAFHNATFASSARSSVKKYYTAAEAARSFYRDNISQSPPGSKALEYGCGPGSQAFSLAASGVEVTGIDISEVAIDQAKTTATSQGLNIDFKTMNAEALSFPGGCFDLICGSGILHHLDLEVAYAELARVLKPSGRAVFLEPLGHNPLINAYRALTPKLRTEDEHPLLMRDLKTASEHFGEVGAHHFTMLSLAASFAPMLRRTKVIAALDRADQTLFRAMPFMRRYSWIVVLDLRKSR